MINLIVAIAENNAIGIAGDLLCHLPNDLKHFKEITTGATVVMGKNTFFSLPRRPLPNRRNIVLTTDTHFAYENTEVAHSIDQLYAMLSNEEEVFDLRVDDHLRQCTCIASELQLHLLYMVEIDMCVTKGVYKVAYFESCHLCHHHE